MEKWKTPKVVIDRFTPDQYIAACTINVNNIDFDFIDLATGSHGGVNVEQWGVGDNFYQWEEDARPALEPINDYTINFDGAIFTIRLPDGWYTNIYLYNDFNNFYRYTGPSGPYDVFVFRDNRQYFAEVYQPGAAAAAAQGKSAINHS